MVPVAVQVVRAPQHPAHVEARQQQRRPLQGPDHLLVPPEGGGVLVAAKVPQPVPRARAHVDRELVPGPVLIESRLRPRPAARSASVSPSGKGNGPGRVCLASGRYGNRSAQQSAATSAPVTHGRRPKVRATTPRASTMPAKNQALALGVGIEVRSLSHQEGSQSDQPASPGPLPPGRVAHGALQQRVEPGRRQHQRRRPPQRAEARRVAEGRRAGHQRVDQAKQRRVLAQHQERAGRADPGEEPCRRSVRTAPEGHGASESERSPT